MNFLQRTFMPVILAYLTDRVRLSRVFEKMSEISLAALIADAREFADALEKKDWNSAGTTVSVILSRIK